MEKGTDFDVKEITKTTAQHEKSISQFNTRITDLETKLANIKKCYSAERYEEFQEAAEKIILRTLESDAGAVKTGKHIDSRFKDKIVWGVLIWLLSVIASTILGAVMQRIFKIFG